MTGADVAWAWASVSLVWALIGLLAWAVLRRPGRPG